MNNAEIKLEKLLNHKDTTAVLKEIQKKFCKSHSSLKALKEVLNEEIEDHYYSCALYHLDDSDIMQIKDHGYYDLRGKTDNEVEEFKWTVVYAVFNTLSKQINNDLNINVWFCDVNINDFTCNLAISDSDADEEAYINIIRNWAEKHKWVGGILNVNKILGGVYEFNN